MRLVSIIPIHKQTKQMRKGENPKNLSIREGGFSKVRIQLELPRFHTFYPTPLLAMCLVKGLAREITAGASDSHCRTSNLETQSAPYNQDD